MAWEIHSSFDVLFDHAWSQLARATADPRHAWRYPALGTVAAGMPQQRTVVIRGVRQAESLVWAYTDGRSPKVSQLQSQPKASWLFYDPKARVQLVMHTQVQIHNGDEVSRTHWERLNPVQYKDYNTAQAPGTQAAQVDYLNEESWDSTHFCVLMAKVLTLELLMLNSEGHVRLHFSVVDGIWVGQKLVP